MTADLEAFSRHVNKRSHDECWEWTGPKDKYGRGLFHGMLAHEFCWLAFFGQIPEEAVVLHRCNSVGCVNPYHLYIVENKSGHTIEFETSTQTDYKLARPGSHEWKEFWQEHPELQEEMLEWRASCNQPTRQCPYCGVEEGELHREDCPTIRRLEDEKI